MERRFLAKERIMILLDENRGLSDNEKIKPFIEYVKATQNKEDPGVMALIGYLAFSGSDIITTKTRRLLSEGIRDGIYSEQVVIGAQRFYEKAFSEGSEGSDSDHTHKSYFFEERGIREILMEN